MHKIPSVFLLLFISLSLPLSGQAFSFSGDVKPLTLDSESIDRQDYMGRTVLMKAARRGDYDAVYDALSLGADPDIRDNNGQSALFHALQYSNPDVIDLLLFRTSLDNPFDRTGRSVLDLYLTRGKVYSSALFNSLGAFVTDPEEIEALLYRDGESVLFKLFDRDKEFRNAVLKDLVYLGCSLDYVNSEGRTPYEEALERDPGDIENTAALLQDIRLELNQSLVYEIYSNPAISLEEAGYFLSRGASADYISPQGFTSCHYAVSAGRPDLLKYLLEFNPEIDPLAVSRQVGLIPFFALNKDYDTAAALLGILFENGISPNSRDGDDRTLMDQAISNSIPLASFILASGADPDMVSPGGVTPLMKLLTMNMDRDYSLLYQLADAGADLRVKDDSGMSIMMYAVLYGQSPEVLAVLLELGASIDERDDYGTPAFFFVSAFQNAPDFLIPLIEEDQRFLWRDKDGWTSLHGAMNFGNSPKMIDALAALYPDGSLRDGTRRSLADFKKNYEKRYGIQNMPELDRLIGSRRIYPAGEVPLFFDPDQELRLLLERGSHPELVSVFVEEGADLYHSYPDGFSPLMTAAAMNSASMVKALLEEGATAFDSTPYGWTPLHVAAWQSDPETAALLLNAGLNVNSRDFDYWTPLHWAARNNPTREYLRVLLDAGADPGLLTYRNDTPLHLACQGWVEPSEVTIKILIEAGADIDASNYEGTTPLMMAAGQGYKEACRILIEAGADVSITDSNGMTAAMLAAEHAHDDLAEYLREGES